MAAATTEQQAAHTPGPWSVCFDRPDPECRDSIAYIRPTNPVDGFWEANEIATVYACDGSDERKANARLMAAAPDQYAALIEIASAIEDAYEDIYQSLPDGVVPDWFIRLHAAAKQARAAIAKATGAQS